HRQRRSLQAGERDAHENAGRYDQRRHEHGPTETHERLLVLDRELTPREHQQKIPAQMQRSNARDHSPSTAFFATKPSAQPTGDAHSTPRSRMIPANVSSVNQR